MARKRDYNVVWLPLKDEYRQKFDEEKAHEWFNKTDGLSYGYHNFIFGWIDTARDNLPTLLADHFAPVLFALVEKLDFNLAYNFFVEGMNKRLGVENYDIAMIAELAAQ